MPSKFKINNVKLVAVWGYNIPVSDCIICRSNIQLSSLNYQEKGIVSNISIGVCGHAFHTDCITPWIENNYHCPICANKWILKNIIYC